MKREKNIGLGVLNQYRSVHREEGSRQELTGTQWVEASIENGR